MNLDNVIFKTFKVAEHEVIVRTFLDDDIAQIIVDDKLVAEYGFDVWERACMRAFFASWSHSIILPDGHHGIRLRSFGSGGLSAGFFS